MAHMAIKIRAFTKARKLCDNLGQHSPACSFHLWSSGSESFSYPWCLAVIGTTVEVSQLEKCFSKGERGSTAPCLLLQSKDTQDTVIRLRTYARVHFSAQIWQRLLLLTGSKSNEVNAAELRCGGPQFIPLFNGTAMKNFHAAAVVRMALSLKEKRRNLKVTQRSPASMQAQKRE